jgi:hypothetical protein
LWYFWLHSVVLVWGPPNFLNFCPIKDFSTLQTFHSRIILGAQFFVYSFFLGIKYIKYIIPASKHRQKVELAADTPQSLGIKELSHTHHRRSSFFNSFVFGMKKISDIGSWWSSIFKNGAPKTMCARNFCNLLRLMSISCQSQLLLMFGCWIKYLIYFHPKTKRIKKELSS